PPPAPRCAVADGRVSVPAGTVLLGEDGPGRPGQRVRVAAFAIDRHEVTNGQFAAFVRATGYRTQAEQQGGGAVFSAPAHAVPLDRPSGWWRFVRGADWRHPTGPQGTIAGHEREPVVQVTLADAAAYARWSGGILPDEAQWERAARGRQRTPHPPRSWAFAGDGTPVANVWEGEFPVHDSGADGHAGLAPVGCFEANDYGLVDMIGNAWEWTRDDRGERGLIKGGSFLCAATYCANYRPAAFQAQEKDLPTSHVGFRTIGAPRRPVPDRRADGS
ncbi:SUMF1/EgtB/PvdO family nonheme iron enzyme, partial [Sphingomonas bacterium]|uniref:SUMF1/EgtB/PvdO family nonheme iron enzyme n=1 Tax=Sphingomonas bacterium TaxID=1895847 RepID=UPI001576D368